LSGSGLLVSGQAGLSSLPTSASWRTYNLATTRRPVICQLDKNVHFINVVLSVCYKKHEICKHFQWPILKRYLLKITVTQKLCTE
jgi:hypothetical protein